MSEEKPSMSMCVNSTDYHQKTIAWQKGRIEQLEAHIKELECVLKDSVDEMERNLQYMQCDSNGAGPDCSGYIQAIINALTVLFDNPK